jgi:hypothetical protein
MTPSLQQVAQRFPLIARPRPACLPLRTLIAELRNLSNEAARGTEAGHLTLAAETLNKSALIASDCGISTLARSLCWRHFSAYLPAWPLDASQARSALEPLINLARLALREHDGARGYLLLYDLFHAVSSAGTADIDGRHIPFDGLTRTDAELHTVRTWLWGVFLNEGIRALISAGQWDQAVAHAQRYRGVGRRLLDGRQATIIAHCLAGDTDTALRLVADSAPEQPWEYAIAGCLDALCNRASGRSPGETLTAVQQRYLELDRAPGLLVFRTRLGLTIFDMAADNDEPSAERLFSSLIGDVLASGDGYAAREVLAHAEHPALLPVAEEKALITAVHAAGLGAGVIPDPAMADLLASVERCEKAIERSLPASLP